VTHATAERMQVWEERAARDYQRAMDQRTPARTPDELTERNRIAKLHAGALGRAARWAQEAHA